MEELSLTTLLAYLPGIFISAATAYVTCRVEVYSSLKKTQLERRVETYDSCIDLLHSFRSNPSISLCPNYLNDLRKLENRMRLYGGYRARKAFSIFVSDRLNDQNACQEELDNIHNRYFAEREFRDEHTSELLEVTEEFIGFGTMEEYERERNAYRKSVVEKIESTAEKCAMDVLSKLR